MRTAFLFMIVFFITLAAPWYTVVGVLVSMFILETDPFSDFRRFLWEIIVWPVKLFLWLVRRK